MNDWLIRYKPEDGEAYEVTPQQFNDWLESGEEPEPKEADKQPGSC